MIKRVVPLVIVSLTALALAGASDLPLSVKVAVSEVDWARCREPLVIRAWFSFHLKNQSEQTVPVGRIDLAKVRLWRQADKAMILDLKRVGHPPIGEALAAAGFVVYEDVFCH